MANVAYMHKSMSPLSNNFEKRCWPLQIVWLEMRLNEMWSFLKYYWAALSNHLYLYVMSSGKIMLMEEQTVLC